MYIEGTDFGMYNSKKPIYPMFGINYASDGGSITSLTGESGSIVEGKTYNFLTSGGANYLIDDISSNGAKIIFQSGGKGKASTYGGTEGKYRALHSTFIFNLVRTESARDELMKIYMDYLIGSTPISEEQITHLLKGNSLISNCKFKNGKLCFTLAHPAKVTVDFYNISGKLVNKLIGNNFTKGVHQVTINTGFSNLGSGEYILNLKAGEEVVNHRIVIPK